MVTELFNMSVCNVFFLNFAAMEVDEIVHHIFGRDIDTSRICESESSSSSSSQPPPK